MHSSTPITLTLVLHLITLVSSQSSCGPGAFFNGVRCRPCRPGTYQNETDATFCERCPTGTFNEIRGAQGIDLCLPCPAGTFFDRNGNPSQADCKPCPNRMSSVPGSKSCVRCRPGQFLVPRRNRVRWNGRVPICRMCATNEISTIANAQKCEKCPFPLVSNSAGTNCVTCRPGFGYVLSGDIVACELCTLFSVSDGTKPCHVCPRGFINSRFSRGSRCSPCPSGTTSDLSGRSCIPCEPGENVNAVGMPFCLPADTPCPENYFFNNDNACQTCSKSERYDEVSKTCAPCGRNQESDGGVDKRCRACEPSSEGGEDGCVCRPGIGVQRDGRCFRCQLGRIWDGMFCDYCKGPFEVVTPGDHRCRECPPGTVPNKLRTACNTCDVGTRPSSNIGFFKEQVGTCVDVTTGCPPDHTRVLSTGGDLVACSPNSCPPRTRTVLRTSDSSDAIPFVGRLRECRCCIPGTVLTREGCLPCEDNERSIGQLNRRCLRCPEGFVRADDYQLDKKRSDGNRCGCFSMGRSRGVLDRRCELCPRGTFGFTRGEDGCRPCPPGLVAARRGSLECSPCPSGMIPNLRQKMCQACPPGTISFGVGETECVIIGSLR